MIRSTLAGIGGQAQSPSNVESMQEHLSKKFLDALIEDLERKKEVLDSPATPPSEISFFRTNNNGSTVTLDAVGRPIALTTKQGRSLYRFHYKSTSAREPDAIELADGTTLKRFLLIDSSGQMSIVWSMNPPNQQASKEFHESAVRINRDGSFVLKYRCLIASTITKEPVLREIRFSQTGKRSPKG